MCEIVKTKHTIEVMSRLWWLLIIIIAVIYLRYYYKYPKEVAILQTTLQNFTFEILREKQPLVIHDRVQSIEELRKTWFKYVISKHLELPADNHMKWQTNKYKYLLMHPSTACEVLLYPASLPLVNECPPDDATLIAIQLAENQILIIPRNMHWTISCVENVRALGVHDYVTQFLP